MVEINNQRKAFLDMLAWSEGIITDVSNQKSWLWRHCRRRAIYRLLRSPSQIRHAKPKTQINRRRTLPASFLLVGCLPQAAWPERLLSEKSDAVALQQIKERGALPMIDRWYPSGNRPLQQYLGFTAGRYYGQFEHKADSLIAKFKEAGGTVREIDVWAESHTPLWLSASSSACHGAVNHYRDNAITYKAQRDKNARELKAGEGGNYWHADASAWCCCAWCKIHEGVSWC